MLLILAFSAISVISSALFYLHPPGNPFVFYPLFVVLAQAVLLSALLMLALLKALRHGPVRW